MTAVIDTRIMIGGHPDRLLDRVVSVIDNVETETRFSVKCLHTISTISCKVHK